MARRYERVDDTDPLVMALRHEEDLRNAERFDALDPLDILLLCEEYEVSVTILIELTRKKP